jgi:hypothetical protein
MNEYDPVTGNADEMSETTAYFKVGKQMKGYAMGCRDGMVGVPDAPGLVIGYKCDWDKIAGPPMGVSGGYVPGNGMYS